MKLGFCFGIGGADDTINQPVNEMTVQKIESLLFSTETEWRHICAKKQHMTDDFTLNAFAEHWLPYELFVEWKAARQTNFTRDITNRLDALRLGLPFCKTFASDVRNEILEFCKRMYAPGLYSFDRHSMAVLDPSDTIWLPYSVAEYVFQTGDTDILNCQLPTRNNTLRSVSKTCIRELSHYIKFIKDDQQPVNPVTYTAMDLFLPSTPKPEIAVSSLRATKMSEFINFIFMHSKTLYKNHQQLNTWLSHAEKSEILQMLMLHLYIKNEIFDK